ncbi:MAG: FHA domain-containing protein [Lachnospiraceae bacterium]|nr:FHA domain-containing protein [Lachnospiraceae bacterium]
MSEGWRILLESEYRKGIMGTELVLWDECIPKGADYRMGMIKNNKIPGILPCNVATEDGEIKLHFDISGKQNLSVLFSKKELSHDRICNLLRSLCVALEGIGEYMLDGGGLVTSPEFVYGSLSDTDWEFAYIPGMEQDIFAKIHGFAEFLISRTDHSDREGAGLAYRFFEITNDREYTVEDIKGLLKQEIRTEKIVAAEVAPLPDTHEEVEIKPGNSRKPKKKNPNKTPVDFLIWVITGGVILWIIYARLLKRILRPYILPLTAVTVVVAAVSCGLLIVKLIKQRKKRVVIRPQIEPLRIPAFTVEEEAFEPESLEEKTGRLTKEELKYPVLHPADGTDEDIELLKFPFVIGKAKPYVDGLANSSYISKVHCKIDCCKGVYNVCDLNSTNGTRLNGKVIIPGEKYEIKNMDRLTLGEMEYVFMIP